MIRSGGDFFLELDTINPKNNGAVLNISQIIKAVMTSTAEYELGAIFINVLEAVPQQNVLEEMGHPHTPTPIQIYNSTEQGVVRNKIQPTHTKEIDMIFHWILDRYTQKIIFYWLPSMTNRGHYWNKYHCAAHYQRMRPDILIPRCQLDAFGGFKEKISF